MSKFYLKCSIWLMVLLCSITGLFAQQAVTGRVTDANGALPGVTISVVGTDRVTQSDENGQYSINASQGETIRFSTIGYVSQDIKVGTGKTVNATLVEDSSEIGEVVVTAMGIKRESKALGYAVSSITPKELTQAGTTNVATALYGKAPGVTVMAAPGGASSAANIQIRGINSINYNRQPLLVVDGVIIRNEEQTGGSGRNNNNYWDDQRVRGNGFLDINPADIESMSILKGSAASALYGSDAASGVIVITTKKGSKDRGLGIDFNYNGSLERAAFLPKFQNEYGPGYDPATNLSVGADEEGWLTDTNSPTGRRPNYRAYSAFGPKFTGEDILWWDGSVRPYVAQPDNYKNIYDNGYNSNINVGISNQTDVINYRLSATRMDYKSTNPGAKQSKNTFNLNSSVKLSDKVSTDIVANYINTNTHNRTYLLGQVLGSFEGFFNRSEDMALLKSVYKNSNGYKYSPVNSGRPEQFTYGMRGYNLLDLFWNQYQNSYDEREDRLLTSGTLNWDIIDKLKFRGRIGNDVTALQIEDKRYNEYPSAFNSSSSSSGGFNTSKGVYNVLYGDVLLTYADKFNDDLGFSVSGGFQSRKENYNDQSAGTTNGLVSENWFSLNNSYGIFSASNARKEKLKYAYFGILNFDFRNYLFLEGTVRNEYSSTLPAPNNVYTYGSASGSFVFSEAFDMTSDVFSYGKLRASYGAVGNDAGIYAANIAYNQTSLQTVNGSVPSLAYGSTYGNLNLRPERKYEVEIGAELKFFNNRLGLDASYYDNYINDQILNLNTSFSTGATAQVVNVGRLANRGLEISLTGTPIANENFSWTTRLNFAKNVSYLEELPEGLEELVFYDSDQSSLRVVARNGDKLGDIYAYPRATDDNGNFLISNDGLYVIDQTRYEKVGNILPKAIGGFTNTFNYKDLSLDFTVDYRFGGQMVSQPTKYMMGSGLFENTLEYRDGGVTLEGVNENTGATNNVNITAADYYLNTFGWGSSSWNGGGAVFDNDFIKMRELAFSYRLPSAFSERMKLNNMRISLVGRNLFYFHRTLENLDPEAPVGNQWYSQGIDVGSSAATRSFGFSINANF